MQKDPLLLVLLCWTALVAGILVWLPLVRGATQGTAYRWALADGIGGQGIGGGYWLLIVAAVFVFSLLYSGSCSTACSPTAGTRLNRARR